MSKKQILKRLFPILAALLLNMALLSCSKQLDDVKSISNYVENNLEGLTDFVKSVASTDEYFESITHTSTHPINEKEASEIVDGVYAIGIINNSLFYEEVSYDFIAEPLEKGIVDTITMQTEYTLSYNFLCTSSDEYSIGFYYTESDKPLYLGKEYNFTEEEEGYSYTLSNGTQYYTQRICDNWYYYKTEYKTD